MNNYEQDFVILWFNVSLVQTMRLNNTVSQAIEASFSGLSSS